MSNVAQLFGDYFRKKSESYSDVHLSPNKLRPRGWLEEFRVEIFQTVDNLSLKSGVLWSRLTGKIYKLEHSQLSVVLALYSNDAILWLDDHSDNFDFEIFIRREDLLTWLPDQLEDFLDLLIQTKFNFLGRPQLIRSVSAIPTFTEEEMAFYTQSQQGREGILEQERRFADIVDQIQPPICTSSQDRVFHLNFYVWTKILGKVIKIHCSFGSENAFSYEAIQLTEQLGKFFVPS
ncbi:MAG: hypothetical protein DPW09_26770 [Anaerolineae bacterium]|nr:hypothetical protein [Anaerolineales bacterium]MCQ3977050.1 hypothetical protein [Anaerolineae bacterium]